MAVFICVIILQILNSEKILHFINKLHSLITTELKWRCRMDDSSRVWFSFNRNYFPEIEENVLRNIFWWKAQWNHLTVYLFILYFIDESIMGLSMKRDVHKWCDTFFSIFFIPLSYLVTKFHTSPYPPPSPCHYFK